MLQGQIVIDIKEGELPKVTIKGEVKARSVRQIPRMLIKAHRSHTRALHKKSLEDLKAASEEKAKAEAKVPVFKKGVQPAAKATVVEPKKEKAKLTIKSEVNENDETGNVGDAKGS